MAIFRVSKELVLNGIEVDALKKMIGKTSLASRKKDFGLTDDETNAMSRVFDVMTFDDGDEY